MKHLVALAIVLSFGLSGCTKSCNQATQNASTADAGNAASAPSGTSGSLTTPPAMQAPAGPNGAVPPAAIAQPSTAHLDLSTDALGLSKATAILKTSKGTLKFKFYSKDAPLNVARIAELVQRKFYNGLVFHRVVPGFVIQTGDNKTRVKGDANSGNGLMGNKVKLEVNGRKHVRGTVGMARATDLDSADTQFYITLGAFPHLDGSYTAVGQVVDFGEKSGDKDALDRISQSDEVLDLHFE